MSVLLTAFVVTAIAAWLSIFGYLLALRSVVARRRDDVPALGNPPSIAIVVPALNEEGLILGKLDDLQRTDYPRGKTTVVVVDGGSSDRTVELVRDRIDSGARIELLCVGSAGNKSRQINHALAALSHEIVVVTDADSRLEPSCVRELVRLLEADRRTALVGAVVRPDSSLLEERLHWWLVTRLWWLEGEALSAAAVSGVCYALRRANVVPLLCDAEAEDVHLARAASERGFRTRICRTAEATEIRVPQSAGELLRFRRRRGAAYVRELLRPSPRGHAPFGSRLARRMRVLHFLVMPKAAAFLAVAAAMLLWTPHWPLVLLVLGILLAPALVALAAGGLRSRGGRGWWQLPLAGGRLLGLTWIALLTFSRRTSAGAGGTSP